jgi:hypothetical protein
MMHDTTLSMTDETMFMDDYDLCMTVRSSGGGVSHRRTRLCVAIHLEAHRRTLSVQEDLGSLEELLHSGHFPEYVPCSEATDTNTDILDAAVFDALLDATDFTTPATGEATGFALARLQASSDSAASPRSGASSHTFGCAASVSGSRDGDDASDGTPFSCLVESGRV